MADKQVFQADTPGRWNRFKWLSRILLIVLAGSVLGSVITITSKQYPNLPNLDPAPKKLTKEELLQLKKSTKFKDYKAQKSEIEQIIKDRIAHQKKRPNNKDRINAGFYRAWEPQAYTSLEANISKLDMIVSEGFFLVKNADTIVAKIDTGLVHLNKKYKKPVLISLSNYVNIDNTYGYFDTADIKRIIKKKSLRTVFINS